MTESTYVLTVQEQKTFLAALNYFLAEELLTLSTQLGLPATGQRHEIIERIYRLVTTPTKAARHSLPKASLAQEGATYPLNKKTLIVKGAYNTNAATKNFLKRLAGADFYFSASSQDWIAARWQQGKPPTYDEFARYWKGEQAQKAQAKVAPPEDWAYHTFEQTFMIKNPGATKKELADAWAVLRAKQIAVVKDFLAKMTLSLR